MTGSVKNILIVVLIIAACAIVYSQVVGFDFINIDDRAYVWENPAVQSGLNSRSIAWAFSAMYAGNWHPLTWLSHMLDAQMFGPWAGGHHLTNAILHTVNSLLVYFVLRSMTGCTWKSATVALLFAVHPAHVESVAWIAERKDVLSTTFWLLTMIAYVRYARSADKGWHKMIPVVILFALGLMAKSMLVTLPFVLLLCDYWPLDRLKTRSDLRPLIIEKLPLFALTIASSVITYIAQSSVGATASMSYIPRETRFANSIISYGRYLKMLVYPFDLGNYYPLDTTSIDPIALASAVIALAVISILVWRYRNGHEYLFTGWLWFLGTLVPVIGFIQVGLQSHADRYTYIPYMGLFVMIVWGVADLSKRFSLNLKVPAAITVVVVLSLTTLAYRQTSLWRSSDALYTHTLSFTRNNQMLLSNLCLFYVAKADAATANEKCTELLAQMPPSADASEILGYLKIQTGKYDEAVRLLQDAARMDPASAQILLRLAQAQALRGDAGVAEQTIMTAMTMKNAGENPQIVAETTVAIADSFAKSGRRDKATEYYQRALAVIPNMPQARAGLEKLGVK
ncbi:MAG: hypothetical protein DMF63_07385 [Acidobacteria bacterium]|nr:MAG: hypothetical protein DMF63_07385 [Acidobacteriota bacterium]